MAHHFLEFPMMLEETTNAWFEETRPGEEICFISSGLKVKTMEEEEPWDCNELSLDQGSQKDRVKLCLDDLKCKGISPVPFPHYAEKSGEVRLRYLITYVNEDSFRIETNIKRLEAYYYLGKILDNQNWKKKASKLLLEVNNERKTKYLRLLSRRVFELFDARGLAHLYTTAFIKPTVLAKLSRMDFYEGLLPAARKLKCKDLTRSL